MAQIKLNYSDTVMRAAKIDRLAYDVEKILTTFQNSAEASPEFWRGEAADAYRRECGNFETMLENTANQLRNLANTIKKVADIIKAADDAAQSRSTHLNIGRNGGGGW